MIEVSDDFFAAAKRMLSARTPEFLEDRYDEHGKWMDGWESRRKRLPGHDYCILRICPGTIYGVDIDTSHFTGNFAPAASLEACHVKGDPDPQTRWTQLLEKTELCGDSHHYLRVGDRHCWTHLRLNIYPDGGIARLRVFGQPETRGEAGQSELPDLACSEAGGEAVYCNDMHYGHMANLIKPGRAVNMGDGWETRRRRRPGNDWVIIRLGLPGVIRRVEVDTDFFKGNHPARCSIRACRLGQSRPTWEDSSGWPLILPEVALGPDQLQVFQREIRSHHAVDHVRLDIIPDGGIARLRLFGEPESGR